MKRLQIIPSIDRTFSMVKDNGRDIFDICWLPFFAHIVLSILYVSLTVIRGVPDDIVDLFYLVLPYLYILVHCVLFYGLYQHFIAQKNVTRDVVIRRGIANEKRYNVRYFWSFDKNIAAIFIFAAFLYSATTIVLQVYNYFEYEALFKTFDMFSSPPVHFLYSRFIIEVLFDLVYAAFILVWPFLILKGFEGYKKLSQPIKATWGNIFRIWLVSILFFLPVYILGSIWLAYTIVAEFGWTALKLEGFWAFYGAIWQGLNVVSDMFYFLGITLQALFVSFIYKELIEEEEKAV